MNTTLPPLAEMERAYLERDASYNGLFYLAVRTTGIFCRPTCPARKPAPKNVEYFSTPQEAMASGYRPCLRCKPLGNDEQPAWATDLLAEVERDPAARISDGELRGRGVDPASVRRFFQKHFGMTFQAFTRARRLSGVLTQIREGEQLDSAVFASGYESHSGFRDAFSRVFGEPPGSYRQGDGDCVRLAWLRSPLGPLVAGATHDGICLLEFVDRRMLEAQFRTVKRLFRAPVVPGTNEHLKQLEAELNAYFARELRTFTVPLVYPGTDFQRRAWKELLTIPYGETRSYQEMAAQVGNPTAVRALGTANGMNRIAIVIPCHRVVNKNGQLGGYGGGLRRKEYLLALERGERELTIADES